MNLNFGFSWNYFLRVVRKTFFWKYKFHCKICGFPTDDIINLHTHVVNKHPDIMRKHLLGIDDSVI